MREKIRPSHNIRFVLFSWTGCTSSVFIFLLQMQREKDKLWTSTVSSAKKNKPIAAHGGYTRRSAISWHYFSHAVCVSRFMNIWTAFCVVINVRGLLWLDIVFRIENDRNFTCKTQEYQSSVGYVGDCVQTLENLLTCGNCPPVCRHSHRSSENDF